MKELEYIGSSDDKADTRAGRLIPPSMFYITVRDGKPS
jgi:hypothetical protein